MEWWEDIYNRQIYFDLYEEADTRLSKQEVRQVVTLLHPQEWARILDLCCGYGRHSSQRWVETIQALWQGCKGYMLIVQSSDELAHFVQADHRQLLNYCKD